MTLFPRMTWRSQSDLLKLARYRQLVRFLVKVLTRFIAQQKLHDGTYKVINLTIHPVIVIDFKQAFNAGESTHLACTCTYI